MLRNPLSRRHAIAAAVTAAALPSQAPAAPYKPGPVRLAVSSYSYWHFQKERYPIESVIEDAARTGFDGVEILHRQMSGEDPVYLNKLKQLAFRNGLALPMLSIHQDFVFPESSERKKHVDHTVRCIHLAHQLGIPAIRLNSGRWKTVRSFDDLMKVKGNEPVLPGYKHQDALKWCVESIHDCLGEAQKAGVVLALENHWGLTTDIDVLLDIFKQVNSPWLGINMDTGNYPGDPYEGIAKLAPYAHIVQAKTYHGGGVWYSLDLDYKRIAGILKKAGFKGWVSLEMEGKEPAATAVPKSYAILREAFSD